MKVGLFIPCYVDALYPEVGVASYKLLTALGLDVDHSLTNVDRNFLPLFYRVLPNSLNISNYEILEW